MKQNTLNGGFTRFPSFWKWVNIVLSSWNSMKLLLLKWCAMSSKLLMLINAMKHPMKLPLWIALWPLQLPRLRRMLKEREAKEKKATPAHKDRQNLLIFSIIGLQISWIFISFNSSKAVMTDMGISFSWFSILTGLFSHEVDWNQTLRSS
jgi:hypothetical protein